MKFWQSEIILTVLAAFCIVLSILCFFHGFKKKNRYNKIMGVSDWAEGKGKRLSIGFGIFLLFLAYKLIITILQ